MPSFDVVIVGAGIAGLGAAIALADIGYKVTVLERHDSLQALGSVIGIMPSGTRVLESYGVLDDVWEVCGDRSPTMIYRRWKDGNVILSQAPSERENLWGIRGASGKRGDFQKILYNAAVKRGVDIRFGTRVVSLNDQETSLLCENGENISADLIVAADGIKSKIKTTINPGKEQLFSGINDYMMNLPVEKVRANPRTAVLLESANSWWGPTGCVIVGIAGSGDNIHFSMEFCVISSDDGSEGNLVTINDIDKIKRYFVEWDPLLVELLDLADGARIWRLAYADSDLNWLSPGGRTILIGDAAHAMLPHAMAGTTTALEDGISLAQCVSRATTTSEIPKYLKFFEDIRKPRLEYIQNGALQKVKMFHLPDGPEQEARDRMFASNPSMVGPSWDGKHIDEPPEPQRRDLAMPYIVGFKVEDFTNKKLEGAFGPVTINIDKTA